MMFCRIYKWKISRSLDRGKGLSEWLSRHVAKCENCKRFYESCKAVEQGFLYQSQSFDRRKFELSDEQLADKVTNSCDNAGIDVGNAGIYLKRLAMAASFVIFCGLSAYFLNSKAERVNSEKTLEGIFATKSFVSEQIEQPSISNSCEQLLREYYSKEIASLRYEGRSAVRFLSECVSIDLEGNNKKIN